VFFVVLQSFKELEALEISSLSASQKVSLLQVKYRLLHGRLERIGEASADTAATETYYMKGYCNLEEETIKVKI